MHNRRFLVLSAAFFWLAATLCAQDPDMQTLPHRRLREHPPGATGTTAEKPLPDITYDLRRDWYVGFAPGGQVMVDAWAPVHIALTNNSKREMQGTLRIRLQDRRSLNTYITVHTMPLVLPGHGTKKHFAPLVYLPKPSVHWEETDGYPALTIDILSATHGNLRHSLPVNALHYRTLKRNDDEETIPHGWTRIPKTQIVFLSRQYQIPIPRNIRINEQEMDIVTTRAYPQGLPVVWQGLAGAGALFIDEIDLGTVLPPAQQAIRDYVQAGGHLILATGASGVQLESSFLRDMLPCRIESGEAYDLGAHVLHSSGLPTTLVARLHPRLGASVVDKAGDLPMVVRHTVGAGSVSVLAFSFQARFLRGILRTAEHGTQEFNRQRRWQEWIAAAMMPSSLFLSRQLHENILREKAYIHLENSARERIPTREKIFAFLAVYFLVMVPLPYMLFRSRQRAEWAWVLMPFIALAFTYASYAWTFGDEQKTLSLTDLSLVRLTGDDPEGCALTFSRLHHQSYETYTLGVPPQSAVPTHLRINEFPGEDLDETFYFNLREDTRAFQLNDFSIQVRSRRFLETLHRVRMGQGMVMDLNEKTLQLPDTNRPLGTLDNHLGRTISYAALLWGDNACVLDPILPGTTQPLRVAKVDTTRRSIPLSIPQALEEMCRKAGHTHLAAVLTTALHDFCANEKRVVLVALLPQPRLDWSVNGKPATARGLSVVFVTGPAWHSTLETELPKTTDVPIY